VGACLTGEATGVLTVAEVGGLGVDNAADVSGKNTFDKPYVCEPSADSHLVLRPLGMLVQYTSILRSTCKTCIRRSCSCCG
jgi:hypothetical protein